MSDQGNDDIKQLYGHLGLDPRSYREIRDDKAGTPEAGKSADWSLLRAVRSRLDQGVPPSQAPPATSAMTAPAPPLPPSASPSARGDSAPQASSAAEEPRAARVEPSLAPTPVPGRESLAASLLASLKAYEVDHAAQRATGSAAPPPQPWAAEQTHSDAPPSPRAAVPEPQSQAPSAAPVAPTTSEPESEWAPTSAQSRASSLTRGVSDGLVSTFRRLQAPRPLTNPDLAKLRLNYGARSEAHGVSQPRDANLREVFARLKRVGDDH